MCVSVCVYMGFPGGATGKEPACQCRRLQSYGSDPWVGKIPWRRKWQPISIYLVFLPGESPWTEEPGGLQSMGSQRIRHDWVTQHTFIIIGLNTLCPPSSGSFWRYVHCHVWEELVTDMGRDPASSQHPEMPGQPHDKASWSISFNRAADETPCFRNFSFYNLSCVGPFDCMRSQQISSRWEIYIDGSPAYYSDEMEKWSRSVVSDSLRPHGL